MAEVILSNRMQALTDMVTPGTVITDVGCDHGFVSVYLVQKGLSPRVIAMDVRSGPLERAREHIREYGLQDRIETRLSDGLHGLKTGEANGMICAGHGRTSHGEDSYRRKRTGTGICRADPAATVGDPAFSDIPDG